MNKALNRTIAPGLNPKPNAIRSWTRKFVVRPPFIAAHCAMLEVGHPRATHIRAELHCPYPWCRKTLLSQRHTWQHSWEGPCSCCLHPLAWVPGSMGCWGALTSWPKNPLSPYSLIACSLPRAQDIANVAIEQVAADFAAAHPDSQVVSFPLAAVQRGLVADYDELGFVNAEDGCASLFTMTQYSTGNLYSRASPTFTSDAAKVGSKGP